MSADLSKKIEAIAVSRHVSANRGIVDLLSHGIEAYEQPRTTFFELADRFERPPIRPRKYGFATNSRK